MGQQPGLILLLPWPELVMQPQPGLVGGLIKMLQSCNVGQTLRCGDQASWSEVVMQQQPGLVEV